MYFLSQVQFARLDEWPSEMRDQDFILREPGIFPRPRMKRDLEDDVIVKLTNLPPNSDIMAQVRATHVEISHQTSY